MLEGIKRFWFCISVHGGIGEDGTMQTLLRASGVPHTGVLHSFNRVFS